MEDSAFNPDERRLCPDGTCVGLIGGDGRCRVCGLRADASTPGDRSTDELLAGAGAEGDEAGTTGAPSEWSGPTESDGSFRTDRRLCDDGSCVGVVDAASGVCPVCGRRAE